MPWPWEDLSLVDRFWLLTAGVHPITRPTPSVRFGMAMAAIRTIERAGEIRWVGRDEHARLLAIADCRCPQPLRGWHDALQADQPRDLDGVAARFALDPLLRTPWFDEAEHLVGLGLVTVERSRFGPLGRNSYTLADVPELRRRRRDLIKLILPRDGSVQDLPADVLDLLVVARAADALPDLLRSPGLYPRPRLADAIDVVTESSRDRLRLEAAAAYRNAVFPGGGPG